MSGRNQTRGNRNQQQTQGQNRNPRQFGNQQFGQFDPTFVMGGGQQLSRRQRQQLMGYVPQQGYGGLPFGFQQGYGGFEQPWQGQNLQGNVQGPQGTQGGRRRRRGRGLDVQGFDLDIDMRNERTQGQFAGRGPKNYRRDDTVIQNDVCEVLARHPAIDATEIEVNVKNGEVVLTGTVIDRNMKLLAERLIDRLSGVSDIQNQIRVVRPQVTEGQNLSGYPSAVGSNAGGRNLRTETTHHRTS